MFRRIYFSFPLSAQARDAVSELEEAGFERSSLHAMAKEGIDLEDLPRATPEQRADSLWLWEQRYWQGTLILFFLLLALALVSLAGGWMPGVMVFLALSVPVFLGGAWFATRLPHTHLDEVKVPLEHGEVVLMVDVPPKQVSQVTRLVEGRHPEAGLAGVGWSLPLANL